MQKQHFLAPISHSPSPSLTNFPHKAKPLCQVSASVDNSMQKSLLEKRKRKIYLEYLMKEKNRMIGRSEIRKMHKSIVVIKPKALSKTEKLQRKNLAL
jgi:hypothetical protein